MQYTFIYTILVIFQFGFPIYSRNKRKLHSQREKERERESCGGQVSRTPSFEDYDDVRDFFPPNEIRVFFF